MLDVVAKRIPHTDQIAGVRILDKSRGGSELMLRLDVWTKFNSDQSSEGQEIKEFIAKEYIDKHNLSSKLMFKNHAH